MTIVDVAASFLLVLVNILVCLVKFLENDGDDDDDIASTVFIISYLWEVTVKWQACGVLLWHSITSFPTFCFLDLRQAQTHIKKHHGRVFSTYYEHASTNNFEAVMMFSHIGRAARPFRPVDCVEETTTDTFPVTLTDM